MKTAACVAVGSELLGVHRQDGNSLEVTAALARYGVRVVEKRVVGDEAESIAACLIDLLQKVDLVVVTGGLGPTADDVTREAAARALGRQLLFSDEAERWVQGRYRAIGREMPEIGRRMAWGIEGARLLPNTRGAAPGQIVDGSRALLVLFPGVPFEMREMLERDLVPLVKERARGAARLSRTLLLGGVYESDTEEHIAHLYERFGRNDITILASYGILRLVLNAEGAERDATARLNEMESAFREILGEDVAGRDVDGLAEVVLELGREAGVTLATAESCTGGTVGAWLTAIPGSSDVYRGGIISYSNEAKEQLLGVPRQMLVDHGAVSEPVARAMAEGARRQLHADWAISITGVAGPGGGTEEKPVGLVHWAVAGPDETWAAHRVFPGDRDVVRQWSANHALDLLRRKLLAAAEKD